MQPTPSNHNACVLLLHGMGRSALSMRSMQQTLKQQGYHTLNQSYPSTGSDTIAQLSQHALTAMLARCRQHSPIHVVTHSLGGILIRQYLQKNQLPHGSRIVMLSPPNHGSEITDNYRQQRWYRFLTGTPGQQLSTDSNSLPNRLAAIDYPIGIITGNRSWEPWFTRLFKGENDGKVSVASARLKEMHDFLVVKQSHTLIMNSPNVQQQVIHFLRYGRFHHPQPK